MHFTRLVGFGFGLLVTIFIFGIIFRETTDRGRLPMNVNVESANFAITSPVFANNEPIPPLYTCNGQNTRPPLRLQRPPVNAKSLTIIMRDPDAVNGDWIHWTAWNIDPATTTLDEKSLPAGAVEGMTSSGKTGYSGPCPPKATGVHRYIFEAYALDNTLNLPASTNRAQLETTMRGHILAQTRMTGSFSAN